MPLSQEEQRVLDSMENELQVNDPVFAVPLNFMSTTRYIRRRTVIAYCCLLLGIFLALAGFGTINALPVAGVFLILNGISLLVMAIVAVGQLLSTRGTFPRLRSS